MPYEIWHIAIGSPELLVQETRQPPDRRPFQSLIPIKYAATGGWGFGHFNDGKPADEAVLNTCFACHAKIESRDLVFNRYAQ